MIPKLVNIQTLLLLKYLRLVFITSYATLAYLADVFIIEEYQGLGLGKWLNLL